MDTPLPGGAPARRSDRGGLQSRVAAFETIGEGREAPDYNWNAGTDFHGSPIRTDRDPP